MFREQVFEVQGKSLNCAVGPASGPPLIMLHGVTRRWQTFLPLAPALTQRFEVHAFDYLGHGLSDRTHRGYRVVDYVETMTALLSLPPFSHQKNLLVYGHSLGSMIAAALAGRLPGQIKAIMLEDPPFDTMGQRIDQTPLLSYFSGLRTYAGSKEPIPVLARQLAELRMTDPATGYQVRLGDIRDGAALRFTAKCLSQLDPEVFTPIIAKQWLEGYDMEAVLSAIKCPALLLQADVPAGGMLTDADAARATGLMSDATHIKLDQTGHLIHWQKTETLLRYVQAFTESLA